MIFSGDIVFSHKFDKPEDWIANKADLPMPVVPTNAGTIVAMELNNNTARTDKQVFDQFSSGDDYGFTKTTVPVRLAQYGNEKLISRSQAKRLLAGLDKFETIILDFTGVEAIGQAFADQVFRVFTNKNPDLTLKAVNTNVEIEKMISRARVEASR